MIIYSSHPEWNIEIVNFFQSYLNQEVIFLDQPISYIPIINEQNKDLICFIPFFGDEELNEIWINFFNVLGTQKEFIGFQLIIFLCGTNEPVELDCPLINQILFYTKFLSLDYYIFPFKLYKKSKIDSSILLEFYSQKKMNNNKSYYSKLIEYLIFDSKDYLLDSTNTTTNLTSKTNKFDSVLKTAKDKNFFIKSFIEECTSHSLIINRASLENNCIFLEKENINLKRLHLISNGLTEIPDLSYLVNLKVLNLSANKLTFALLTNKLPSSLEVINLSKNLISSIEVNQVFPNIKKLILFNNPFISLDLNPDTFPNLKYLNIGWIPSLKKIPDAVFSFKNLESLCLSHLTIDYFDQRVLEIENLNYIDIRGLELKQGCISIFMKELIKKGVQVVC